MMKPIDRMFSEMKAQHLEIKDISDALCISTQVVSSWKIRKSLPKTRIPDVAPIIGVTIDWLLTGEGDKHDLGALEHDITFDRNFKNNYQASRDPSVLKLLKKGHITIPIYNIEASAGAGLFINHEHVSSQLRIDSRWARQNIGQIHGKLVIIYVSGDSMSQTFQSGDMIVVDLANIDLKDLIDGIHVLRLDDKVMVKRIQIMPNKRIKVISDNPAYEPFELDEKNDFQILGRVRWAWNGKQF